MKHISCRKGCGACCVAPSLSSPIPGMPEGKPAGVRCVNLTPENQCLLFGRPERPGVCNSYQASAEYCGKSRDEALYLLNHLEAETRCP